MPQGWYPVRKYVKIVGINLSKMIIIIGLAERIQVHGMGLCGGVVEEQIQVIQDADILSIK